jgi:hypothetical protein
LIFELELVQQRIQSSAVSKPFVINVANSAREFLLTEGTDFRYGARPLKRAIERLLVQPLSNLMASGQIHGCDRIRATRDDGSPSITFFREVDDWEMWLFGVPDCLNSAGLICRRAYPKASAEVIADSQRVRYLVELESASARFLSDELLKRLSRRICEPKTAFFFRSEP